MLTDTHCHLASPRYESKELPDLLARAQQAGVHRIITLATSLQDLPAHCELAQRSASVFFCAGIHPCEAAAAPDDLAAPLTPYLSLPKLAAIGEAGLDYYHPAPEGWEEEAYHAKQRRLLAAHFELAAHYGLNIVLHTRDRGGSASFDDALALYRPYADRVRAVFHCFPGSIEQAQRIFDLGGLVSFTGNVTFKNAAQIRETARQVPLNSLMFETDAPYLAPEPYRGTRNEPAHTLEVAKVIAAEKNLPLSVLCAAVEENVNSFFRL